jgi:thiol:disulfide interchange protein DsbA
MKLKRVFILILSMCVFGASLHAADKPKIEGSYEQLTEQAFVFDGKQVEIVEFLNFYCGHCYNFEKAIPIIKGNFPKKIKWRTVPLYWGKSAKAVEAFFLAEEEGKGEEMKRALFKAVFVEKRDVSKVDVVEKIGMDVGMGFDFSRKLRAGEKSKEVGEAIIKSQAYKVSETPTLIVAGNLKVTAHDTGHSQDAFRNNVITIVKSLLKK